MNKKQWAYTLLNIGALVTTNMALLENWDQLLEPVFVSAFVGGIVTIFGAALASPDPQKKANKPLK
jgi:hypothetical protein